MWWRSKDSLKRRQKYMLLKVGETFAVEVEHENGERQYYYDAKSLAPFWTSQKELDAVWMPEDRAKVIFNRLTA